MRQSGSADSLLGPGDPPPVEILDADGESPFLIVADHAGRATPRQLDRLGLPEAAFDLHIGHDIGVRGLARHMAATLGATVISQPYSRLVIDCNRAPDDPRSILETSDGVDIPGNIGLDAAGRTARVSAIHEPYHRRISERLGARRSRGLRTVLVCQHSFTPVMGGLARRWHVGVLHLGDSAISRAMLELLSGEADLEVGDNEPYAMDGTDYTAPFHARNWGCEILELEVRQDLIVDEAGQAGMAARLARLLPLALEYPAGAAV